MDSESQPLVSIVIPCLNRAHYLVPTIESVLWQDYANIECIVVDGGSTDGTLEILQGYGDRVRWVSEPDEGHADAINKGWAMSRGEILAWLNADDTYAVPHAIGTAVEHFLKSPGVDVLYGDLGSIGPAGKMLPEVSKASEWDLEYAVEHCQHIIFQASSFFRRSILEKVGWLDKRYVQAKDHNVWLRIGLVGSLKYVPVLFAYERQGPGLSQRGDICSFKILLTKEFLATAGIEAPFNSARFKRRAMSNAYLMASLYSWLSRHFGLYARYQAKAVLSDPLNLPHIISKTSQLIAAPIYRNGRKNP